MEISKPNKESYLSTEKALGLPDGTNAPGALLRVVENIVGIGKFNDLMSELGPPWPDANEVVSNLFEILNIRWEIENPELLDQLDERPKVFVANHPYGLPDAFALFQLLTKHRQNIRIFANKIISATKLDDERLLYVDPFGAPDSRGLNRKSIAAAIRHLRSGGDLALFPGRICSHLKTSDWTISDSDWTDQVRNFVETCDGDMVPLYITGRNSLMFNISGLIHPRIRTYMLLREFLRGGHDFTFRVGDPVSANQLRRVSRSMSVGSFSRSLVYGLKTGSAKVHDLPHLIEPELRSEAEEFAVSRQPIATGGREVKKLLEKNEVFLRQNGFTIFNTGRGATDQILDIIAEIRFGAYASETSVKDPEELKDKYDSTYNHLILWDDRKSTVAGVYRYTLPSPGELEVSADNLVTNSIFDLTPEFEAILPNSMELGRAAILPEYQKTFSPLMLLWRAILEVPLRDHNVKYLFGPVTMGRKFTPLSRELLRRFIMTNCAEPRMAGLVKPKKRLEFDIPREVDINRLEEACGNFSQLGNIVSGLEGGKRFLPVLFRHYVNAGCKFIDFGEWKELDHATAGLTILDLKNVSPKIINRYFGQQGAEAFLAAR